MEKEKVSFYSAGNKLVGYLRVPRIAKGAKKKLPGIVCCHGFGGFFDLEVFMQDIAESLSQAGYATLIFYHRGQGESEGAKGRIIPWEQSEDIRNAITYLQTRKEIDPDRIALYGTSLGGANVIYTTAMDSRVKCVVETGGIGDGERWLKSVRRRWEWVEFLKTLDADRKQRVLTGKSRIVDPNEILPHDPTTWSIVSDKFKTYGKKWGITGYPLETADALIDFKPEEFADLISPRAALFIHTGNDVLVPPDESWGMYEMAEEPKKIVILENCIHDDVYKAHNPKVFEQVMSIAKDWYAQYFPC